MGYPYVRNHDLAANNIADICQHLYPPGHLLTTDIKIHVDNERREPYAHYTEYYRQLIAILTLDKS